MKVQKERIKVQKGKRKTSKKFRKNKRKKRLFELNLQPTNVDILHYLHMTMISKP